MLISVAVTRAEGISAATVTAMAPEPVPTSRTAGALPTFLRKARA